MCEKFFGHPTGQLQEFQVPRRTEDAVFVVGSPILLQLCYLQLVEPEIVVQRVKMHAPQEEFLEPLNGVPISARDAAKEGQVCRTILEG